MILKRLKKVIITFIILKFVVVIFFVLKSDLVSISRDINYSNNYQDGFNPDSLVLPKQKSIQIVRNEDARGITIKLRGKKNSQFLREKKGDISVPLVD